MAGEQRFQDLKKTIDISISVNFSYVEIKNTDALRLFCPFPNAKQRNLANKILQHLIMEMDFSFE